MHLTYLQTAITFCSHFNSRLPYDWETPATYLTTMFFQIVKIYMGTFVDITYHGFFATCCELLIALVRDAKHHFHDLSLDANDLAMGAESLPQALANEKRIMMMEKLHQILQFHGEVKELVPFFKSLMNLIYPSNSSAINSLTVLKHNVFCLS